MKHTLWTFIFFECLHVIRAFPSDSFFHLFFTARMGGRQSSHYDFCFGVIMIYYNPQLVYVTVLLLFLMSMAPIYLLRLRPNAISSWNKFWLFKLKITFPFFLNKPYNCICTKRLSAFIRITYSLLLKCKIAQWRIYLIYCVEFSFTYI